MSARHVRRFIPPLLGLVATLITSAAIAANPAGLYYADQASSPPPTWANFDDFKHPTAMLVTGRCNRTDTHYAQARAAGAEVLAYINPVDILDFPATCQAEFFTGAQRWPSHKDANGNDVYRSQWPNSHLADIQVGSSWSDAVVAYVENIMRAGQVDGVMLDVLGGHLWSNSDWSNWPAAEQAQWTAGAVDLARRINDSRKRINPFFIIINNNYWSPQEVFPDPNTVYPGEQYVDGIMIENHPVTDLTTKAWAQRNYGNPGAGLEHRRVITISNTAAKAQAWSDQVPEVTHVAVQNDTDKYRNADAPPSGVVFTALTDRPQWFGRVDYGANQSTGMTADFKRATKYTLATNGTLKSLWGYLDGAAAASGMQEIRMVLYRDNNGVPGTKVTESNSKWLGAAAPGGWREFIVPQTALTAGNYWIGFFTGATGGLARNYSDNTTGNWYGNADTFSDGAASPFGTGNTGVASLSVFATYTVP